VLEEEAPYLSNDVRVTLILKFPQAGQNRLVKKVVQIRCILTHIQYIPLPGATAASIYDKA
jgi:hypothetical protein